MAEDAGKLTVEYAVISDAAMRKLEKLQVQIEKVETQTKKMGKATDSTFKKSGKAMAAFGAVATGVLYGIIRASAYSSMWLDQISHQMTRLATKILEITGADKAIELFIGTLDNLNDEIDSWGSDEDNDFWKRLGEDWEKLSTKGKIVTIAIGAIGIVLGILAAMSMYVWATNTIAAFAATGLGAKALALSTWILNGALKALGVAWTIATGPVGPLIIAIAALSAILVYLWLQTDAGKACLEQLLKIWTKFKSDISDVGWLQAITNALKNLGTSAMIMMVWITKEIWTVISEFASKAIDYVYNTGKKIIEWLITGINDIFPGFTAKVISIYNKIYEVFEYVKTYVYNTGKKIIDRIVTGISEMFPGFSEKVQSIYDKIYEVFEYIKTYVYDAGKKIIDWIITGIAEKFPLLAEAIGWISTLWGDTGDDLVYDAGETGKKLTAELAAAAETASETLGPPWEEVGTTMNNGLETGLAGASDSVCDEMIAAGDCVDTGVSEINTKLGEIEREITITANIDYGESIGPGNDWDGGVPDDSDGGGGGGGGGGWSFGGWADSPGFDASATGGHVLRTGKVTVHQGEDILHLKSLLAGAREPKMGGDIVINPTINIQSSGVNGDPFETNRVADVISKRMGDELRRITSNI